MTAPGRKPEFAVRVFDLHAELNGHVRTDLLGQSVLLRQGEQHDIQIHIEDLGLKVSFWLAAETAVITQNTPLVERVAEAIRGVPLSVSSTRRNGSNGLRNAAEVAQG